MNMHLFRRWRAVRVVLAATLAVCAAGAIPATALAQGGAVSSYRAGAGSGGGGGQDLTKAAETAQDKGTSILTALGILAGGAAVIYGVFIERSPKIALLAILGTVLAAWAVNGGLWSSGEATSNSLVSGNSSQSGRP